MVPSVGFKAVINIWMEREREGSWVLYWGEVGSWREGWFVRVVIQD